MAFDICSLVVVVLASGEEAHWRFSFLGSARSDKSDKNASERSQVGTANRPTEAGSTLILMTLPSIGEATSSVTRSSKSQTSENYRSPVEQVLVQAPTRRSSGFAGSLVREYAHSKSPASKMSCNI
jgi:hypothetical protein